MKNNYLRKSALSRLTDEQINSIIDYYEKSYPEIKGSLELSKEYECIVSSKGRAFSLSTKRGELGVKPSSNHGYHMVKGDYLHRIIYKTFSNKPYDPFLEIDHIDGNKSNNAITNLRQLNHKENIENAILNKNKKHWRLGEAGSGKNNVLSKPVLQIDPKTDKVIKEWESQNLAARTLGINHAGINLCVNGKAGSCGGFKWRNK